MTPKREQYMTGISLYEKMIRNDIKHAKNLMTDCKMQLTTKRYDFVESLNGIPEGYFAKNEYEAKARIAVCKKYLKLFKSQLPQLRPHNKLRPCPFCGTVEGGIHIRIGSCLGDDAETYDVMCEKCGVATWEFDSVREAVEAWNRRA